VRYQLYELTLDPYDAMTRPSISKARTRSGSLRPISSDTLYGSLPSKIAQFSVSSPSLES
jgi:hypothetical protein